MAVNFAIALARTGARVGMIDGDIYGPNVPIMLGVRTQLQHDGEKIMPAEKYGILSVSMGFLTNDDAPVIWRGPMLHGVIQQFFRDVRWPELDYLVVDMPPGTGDVALSLSQSCRCRARWSSRRRRPCRWPTRAAPCTCIGS